jgi:hypothetical protein
MLDHDRSAGRSSSAGSQRGQDQHAPVGKGTLADAHAARVPPDPNSVPDLATTVQLKRELATSYLQGPKGTVLEAQLSARIYGNSHTHGGASIGGSVTTENGKPAGDVGFTFRNHDFAITLAGDGHLKAEASATGSWHDYKATTKVVSKGSELTISMDGYINIPGPHGSLTQLGFGINLDLRVLKKPPRGVEVEPEPVTIPLKVLIPTLGGAAAGGALLVIARGILEGIAAEAIG